MSTLATLQRPAETELPGPGLYPGMSADTYHALPYASNSYLGALKRSPAHCQVSMEAVDVPTPAKVLGQAAHYCILEPELFGVRYVVAGQCEGVKKDKNRCTNNGLHLLDGAWFCGVHAPAIRMADNCTVLSQADYDKCRMMADSVRANAAACELLDGRTETELTAIWKDEQTGAMCKMRADLPCEEFGIIGDLKTTEDASDEFERSIFSYGYYTQAAHYLDGMRALGKKYVEFSIIAVEKSAPYGVAVYTLDDKTIDAGRSVIRKRLPIFASCQQAGIWPGYPQTIRRIGLTPFALSKIAQDCA